MAKTEESFSHWGGTMRNSPLSDLLKQHKRIFSSFIVCFSLFSVRLFSRNRFFNLVLTKYSVFRLWASCKAASADGSQKKNSLGLSFSSTNLYYHWWVGQPLLNLHRLRHLPASTHMVDSNCSKNLFLYSAP